LQKCPVAECVAAGKTKSSKSQDYIDELDSDDHDDDELATGETNSRHDSL